MGCFFWYTTGMNESSEDPKPYLRLPHPHMRVLPPMDTTLPAVESEQTPKLPDTQNSNTASEPDVLKPYYADVEDLDWGAW